jgi:hypothetical protein
MSQSDLVGSTFLLFFSYLHPVLGKVYYMLYADGDQMPSKVAIDLKEASLGRIRADYITPPHSLTSFKLYLSRVERNLALTYAANLFEEISSASPLEEGQISNLRTGGPGLSPNEPMAIVLTPIPGPDGKYIVKNRAGIFWGTPYNPIRTVCFYTSTLEIAKTYNKLQVN